MPGWGSLEPGSPRVTDKEPTDTGTKSTPGAHPPNGQRTSPNEAPMALVVLSEQTAGSRTA